MMPHPERSIFPWNWAHYPENGNKVSPWIEAFVNARNWLQKNEIIVFKIKKAPQMRGL